MNTPNDGNPFVALVSTVRATVNETMLFAYYYINLGVSLVVLYFDDPEDPAIPLLAPFPQVKCIPCDEKHWLGLLGHIPGDLESKQRANATDSLTRARSAGCDWLVHVDSDELIDCPRDLPTALATRKSDIVRFSLLEAVSHNITYSDIYRPTLFRKPGSRISVDIARRLCPGAFFEGEYIRGHTASKTAVRLDSPVQRIDIHGPYADPALVEEKSTSITLLHFDGVGIDNWKTKWTRRLDGTTRAVGMRRNRVRQMQRFREASLEGDDALLRLYGRISSIRSLDRLILRGLGLLVYREIPRRRFEPPPIP